MHLTHSLTLTHTLTPLLAQVLAACNCPLATPPATPTPVAPTEAPPSPTAPATASPTPPASPTAFNPAVEFAGEPEVVYRWATDRCADDHLPDLPARAFRDADGMVQLILPSPSNHRLIGPSLDSLSVDCEVILASGSDPDPAQYDFQEWLASPYTLDGQTIHALVHNEYYGEQGSAWQADRDFRGEQGAFDWSYQDWSGGGYTPMTFDAANDRWQGRRPLCQIAQWGLHPDVGCQPARTWISPVSGTVNVNGRVYDTGIGGGDGVVARIFHGAAEVWSATIEEGDATGQAYDLNLDVQAGETLTFRVEARGDASYDSTFFSSDINLGPIPARRARTRIASSWPSPTPSPATAGAPTPNPRRRRTR